MRNVILLLAAVLILVPLAANAAAPLPGLYKSTLGTMLAGRATESMPADFADGQIGNILHGESWNGALGTEWTVTCGALGPAGPTKTYDDRDATGAGLAIYETNYTGGKLWLSGAGLWGNGDAQYTSDLSLFKVTAYKTYTAGNPIPSVDSDIAIRGLIDGYDTCFDLAIANAELIGLTPYILLPGYPAFQGPTVCTDVGLHGTYWNVHDISLHLWGGCIVPTQSSTWGAIKTLYR